MVIDPQRDIDRVLDLAGDAGVRITHIFETHIHNDYVTGGLALARATGAAYHVNAADPVTYERVAMRVTLASRPSIWFRSLVHAIRPKPPAWYRRS